MFLIYRNRSANIGIEMKLKKLSLKMIKEYAVFLEEDQRWPVSQKILPGVG
jgi:hypothetical protein